MKEIPLTNYKTQSLAFAVFCFGLFIFLIGLSLTKDIELSISGAELDSDTSFVLLLLISLFPLLAGINYLIKFITISRFKKFVIELNQENIVYPTSQTFKGFLKREIPKSEISEVRLVRLNANHQHIYLMNSKAQLLGYIDSEILPLKKMNSEALLNEIKEWMLN